MRDTPQPEAIPPAELREIIQTVSGSIPAVDQLARRLHYVAEVMAGLGALPGGPVLAWRDIGGCVRHADIASELVVGRQAGDGLTFAEDELLSRHHFKVCYDGATCALEDLNSRNGTTVNSSEDRIRRATVRDGDLIYAGRQIFVYLNPARM
jgi:hypothetical protein